MSRYRPGRSYGHHIRDLRIGRPRLGVFEISWTVDFYYSGSRLRYPRRFRRIADEAGAKRFCRKHELTMPVDA